jgi:alanine dehydrogenase
MDKINIGIIREGKVPMDKRVPILPEQAKFIKEKYPQVEIFCQSSAIRCVKDAEYEAAGIKVVENIENCDILFGVKEVPIKELIAHKTYFFFSHTIKKQHYNRNLLLEILKKNIRLIDYETLTDQNNNRIIAFGRFAGIVGAYNGLLTYGKKYDLFELPRAKDSFDLESLKKNFNKILLPPVKILISGGGRVSNGAKEVLIDVGVKEVSPDDFLHQAFSFPVFTQIRSKDYNVRIDNTSYNSQDFYNNPELFTSDFLKFTKITDIFMAAAYWNPQAPRLFTREDMLQKDFSMKVIADITCDIQGSIPCTVQASTISDPFYDYEPVTDMVMPPFTNPEFVTVMAIDNLPGELPRDASESFGNQLINNVIPALIEGDKEGIIKKAIITDGGSLTPRFSYLQDFVDGERIPKNAE